MASALRQPIISLASKVLQISPKATVSPLCKAVSAPHIATRGLTLRSFWCATSPSSLVKSSSTSSKHGAPCGCCSLHTEGDKKLSEFLSNEISSEKEAEQAVTSIPGWEAKTDGTGVVLTKSFNDESLRVEFDVNNSVDSDEHLYDAGEEKAPEMIARPPFEVVIQKKSGRKLRFFCEFSIPEPSYDDGAIPEESIEDQFSIVEVRLDDDKKSGDYDKSYTHSGAVMDGTLYDMLMDMLDERGIDEEFINNLQSYATSYEYKLYVNFLENLQAIVKEN
ncbi:Complement component 1 Q subcomponent-binding protein [Mactra antiquata]